MSVNFKSGPPKPGSLVSPFKAEPVTIPATSSTTAPPPVAHLRPTARPPLTGSVSSGPEVGVAEKVQALYKQLSHAAADLNNASDQLVKPIKVWESALKKLNLGVPAWVNTSKGGEDPEWWDRGVGYARLKDGWGIALRSRRGNDGWPDRDSEDLWAFNEAPRWLRIEGVGKLPDLLAALLKQAEDTTIKLKAKVTQANELAEAINAIAVELAALEGK